METIQNIKPIEKSFGLVILVINTSFEMSQHQKDLFNFFENFDKIPPQLPPFFKSVIKFGVDIGITLRFIRLRAPSLQSAALEINSLVVKRFW